MAPRPGNRVKFATKMLNRSAFFLGVCLLLCSALGEAAAAVDPALLRLRAERRQKMREAVNDPAKVSGPALAGLLVIPVDFADERLPANWDAAVELSPRLGSGQPNSLGHYFSVASRNLLELRITLAPLIHLAGPRQEYSDIGFNGFTRTRALATEALNAVKDLGLEFRRLDMEGPDRIVGSPDDDGEVDGVLILHAGPGEENDPEQGLIQALQFFLEEPVVSDGIRATFYATASMHSGLGIWSHETGHLLGMEDRYDPLLPGEEGISEIHSRGGLGLFSLMAAGAWGRGGGKEPALPDGYTCLQMGWCEAVNLPDAATDLDTLRHWLDSGQVARIWSRGEVGPEFFLLETRGGPVIGPYDTQVPANQLLIYHVDESVPEGSYLPEVEPAYHLRVHLMEADGDDALRLGLDEGRPEDLFPGPLSCTVFAPWTLPSSQSYAGPSNVVLEDIMSLAEGVHFRGTAADGPSLEFNASFVSQAEEVFLSLEAEATGEPFGTLECLIRAIGEPAWGSFPGGALTVEVPLTEIQPGAWELAQPLPWIPDPDVPAGAQTLFVFVFQDTEWNSEVYQRLWVWSHADDALDFAALWPGQWALTFPHGNMDTQWHRWNGPPYLQRDSHSVLACTGAGFPTPSAWPEVQYENSAWTALTSGPLGPEILGVRMVYAVEAESLAPALGMDGLTVSWQGPDGSSRPATLLDGWSGLINPRSDNPLHGSSAFFGPELSISEGYPLWQTDIVLAPTEPGPWKLQLAFASNSLWRMRGAFVARLDAVTELLPESAFPAAWGSGLVWSWPFSTVTGFQIQFALEEGGSWRDLIAVPQGDPAADGIFHLERGVVLDALSRSNSERILLRVVGEASFGSVASRPVVVYGDGGAGPNVFMTPPWPNPGRDDFRFMLDVPTGKTAILRVYDLAGRLVRDWAYPAGRHLIRWDGRDHHGLPAASGTYLFKLTGLGASQVQKVVLIR